MMVYFLCREKVSYTARTSINLEGTAVRYTLLYLLSKWSFLKIAKGVQRYPPPPVLFVKNCSQGQAVISLLIGSLGYIPEPVLLVDLMLLPVPPLKFVCRLDASEDFKTIQVLLSFWLCMFLKISNLPEAHQVIFK